MSLERALHDLWSADHALSALVPPQRLFTGLAAGSPAAPFVVLATLGNRPAVRTSGGRTLDEAALRFRIWGQSLEQARAIAAEIARRFDRRAFEQAGVRVLQMRRAGDAAAVELDGLWRVLADYLVMYETTS